MEILTCIFSYPKRIKMEINKQQREEQKAHKNLEIKEQVTE